MKIGIFGGSFNPPHKMHTDIAFYLLNNKYLDKVIFVPTGTKYEFKNNLAPNEDRYNMLNLALEGQKNIEVSDYEQKDKLIYTCETLEHFKEVFPNDEIYFICGADNLSYIDEWKNGLSILENYKILVIKRQTQNLTDILNRFKKYQNNLIVVDMQMNSLSSTEIRDKIKNGEHLTSLYIHPKVLEYIKKKGLYKD